MRNELSILYRMAQPQDLNVTNIGARVADLDVPAVVRPVVVRVVLSEEVVH